MIWTVEGEAQIRDVLLKRYGLRVQPEMAQYLLRQLSAAERGEVVPLIGGDARTGMPMRQRIAIAELQGALGSSEISA